MAKFILTLTQPYEVTFEKLPMTKHNAFMNEVWDDVLKSIPDRMQKFVDLCTANGYPVKLVKLSATKFVIAPVMTTTTPVAVKDAAKKPVKPVLAVAENAVPKKRGRPKKETPVE
jgi:hypothetical protein